MLSKERLPLVCLESIVEQFHGMALSFQCSGRGRKGSLSLRHAQFYVEDHLEDHCMCTWGQCTVLQILCRAETPRRAPRHIPHCSRSSFRPQESFSSTWEIVSRTGKINTFQPCMSRNTFRSCNRILWYNVGSLAFLSLVACFHPKFKSPKHFNLIGEIFQPFDHDGGYFLHFPQLCFIFLRGGRTVQYIQNLISPLVYIKQSLFFTKLTKNSESQDCKICIKFL